MFSLLIFGFGSIFGVLLGSIACQINKRFVDFFFCLMIVAIFFPDWSMNFVSREYYRSQTRGFEVHVADLCALILLSVILLNRKKYRLSTFVPLFIPAFIFFIFSFIAWLGSDNEISNPFYGKPINEDFIPYPYFETKLYPLFETFALVKSFIVFWILLHFFKFQKYIHYVVIASLAMVYYFGLGALINRYVYGMNRVSVLYFVTDFNCVIAMLASMIFPMMFIVKSNIQRTIYFIGTILALITMVLSITRSGMFSLTITMVFTAVLCLVRSFNTRNIIISCSLLVAALLVFAKGYETLFNRFFIDSPLERTMLVRERYEQNASRVADDYFFGVGLGNYTAYLMHYYPHLAKNGGAVMVHNIWYLTRVEVGFFGLLAFIFYWMKAMLLSIITLWRSFFRSDLFIFGVILGCFCALLNFQFRGFFNFTYRNVFMLYYTQTILSIIVSQYFAIRQERQVRRKEFLLQAKV